MHKIIMLLSLATFASLPLMADKESGSAVSMPADSPIPDVPEFSIIYQGEALVCSPIELIKTKTHKDLVKYQCQEKYEERAKKYIKGELFDHPDVELKKKEKFYRKC